MVIVGGCDGGDQEPQDDEEEAFIERDRSDLHVLDTTSMSYLRVAPSGPHLPPRSGHSVHLLPCDDGLCLLVLGGRDYRPPLNPWHQDGQHLGRDDAMALMLTAASRGFD